MVFAAFVNYTAMLLFTSSSLLPLSPTTVVLVLAVTTSSAFLKQVDLAWFRVVTQSRKRNVSYKTETVARAQIDV
jgi:hypothetical protein